ncbi:MAG: YigZ family protein [Bacteroidia bacterium]
MSIYKTIQNESHAEFKDRGSRFIAYTFGVSSKSGIEDALKKLAELHPKARHVCYAYKLLNGEYRANDDGEPSGSAGLPILNQIKSADVVNVLVAVVRYFGGTKLGVSGLINAYKITANEALIEAGLVEKEETEKLTVVFDYGLMEAVMSFIKRNNVEIEDNKYTEMCTLYVQIRKSQHHEFIQYFKNLGIKVSES